MSFGSSAAHEDTSHLLRSRQDLSQLLQNDPYSADVYLKRASVYGQLGYPDLAVMDAYKALLLTDEINDDAGEYHSQAVASWQTSASCTDHANPMDAFKAETNNLGPVLYSDNPHDVGHAPETLQRLRLKAWLCLSRCLTSIGCFRTAHDFIQNALRGFPQDTRVLNAKQDLTESIKRHLHSPGSAPSTDVENVSSLPDRGLVRREVYPWNDHEQGRISHDALKHLNEVMGVVAPKLEVRVTDLPVLSSDATSAHSTKTSESGTRTKQFGVFAKDDISNGEEILCERSLLTANARLHEPLCDACSAPLPPLENYGMTDAIQDHPRESSVGEAGPVECPNCDDTIFCSQECQNLAQASYHRSICGCDVEPIAKDVPPTQAADALYTQLLFRSMSMSVTQNVHPLDLKELKYVWGDFNPTTKKSAEKKQSDKLHQYPLTLPFDFQNQIVRPLHFLQQLDISPFEAQHGLSEAWVYNTLFAKFRGTASARISPRDGRPEVAAVHPMWCLANHSCDPNVEWEWAGEIRLRTRLERVAWTKKNEDGNTVTGKECRKALIQKDEEVFNHYVDIDLPVKDRREWALGALGGHCMCERCCWEADTSTPGP